MSKKIGYIRVSTFGQNPDRQLEGLTLDKVFVEHASGKDTHRPQLALLLDYVRDGDQLFVHSMDRLARNSEGVYITSMYTCYAKGARRTLQKETVIYTALNAGQFKSP